MRKSLRTVFLASALLVSAAPVAAPVTAAQAGEAAHLRYTAYWGGLHTADFLLSFDLNGEGFDHAFRLETRGLARLFTRSWVHADSRGQTDGNPERYYLDYASKRRERTVELIFDPKSGEAVPKIETKGRDDDDEVEAEVPPEMRFHTIDPLTGVAEALRRLRDHVENGGPAEFTLPIYDGRRRFDVRAEYRGKTTQTIARRSHMVHELRLAAEPKAGFKDKHAKTWRETEVTFYVSTDGRFVPLRIDTIGPGPVITLAETCPTRAACTPPSDD